VSNATAKYSGFSRFRRLSKILVNPYVAAVGSPERDWNRALVAIKAKYARYARA